MKIKGHMNFKSTRRNSIQINEGFTCQLYPELIVSNEPSSLKAVFKIRRVSQTMTTYSCFSQINLKMCERNFQCFCKICQMVENKCFVGRLIIQFVNIPPPAKIYPRYVLDKAKCNGHRFIHHKSINVIDRCMSVKDTKSMNHCLNQTFIQ